MIKIYIKYIIKVSTLKQFTGIDIKYSPRFDIKYIINKEIKIKDIIPTGIFIKCTTKVLLTLNTL